MGRWQERSQAGSSAGLESGLVSQNKRGEYLCRAIPEKAESAQRMRLLGESLVSNKSAWGKLTRANLRVRLRQHESISEGRVDMTREVRMDVQVQNGYERVWL